MILAFWVKPGKDLELYFSHYNFLLRTESHGKALAFFFSWIFVLIEWDNM